MDLARIVYSRELKVSAMRAMDAGESGPEVARRLQVSPKLLEKWRSEWRVRGEAAFPGKGNRSPMPVSEAQRVAELERKVGQLALENDFLKKPWRISGNITRQPSSVAPLCAAAGRRNGASGRAGEVAVRQRGAEPGQLLPWSPAG
jgi:transposase